MRKTDKKIDNQICKALTDVCENALEDFKGFEWLTHLVNYSHFPKSLKIVCVFDTNANLARFMTSKNQQSLSIIMQEKLLGIGVDINDMSSHISFDTEENCDSKDGGDWGDRLSRKSHFN
jgi:hypothetical protein